MFKMANREKTRRAFILAFIAVLLVFAASIGRTDYYNGKQHSAVFAGDALFSATEEAERSVSVKAIPRGSTWTKLFDFDDEGLTEDNYQAYTYDFTVSNNTRDLVEAFSFKFTFGTDAYLASGWNGATEIHQSVGGQERVALIPDLRDYSPGDYALDTETAEGDTLIPMKAGDYFVYMPSTSMNALEVPIEAYEGTTPGFILYVAIGDSIETIMDEIEKNKGRQFDPEIADVMLRLLREGKIPLDPAEAEG